MTPVGTFCALQVIAKTVVPYAQADLFGEQVEQLGDRLPHGVAHVDGVELFTAEIPREENSPQAVDDINNRCPGRDGLVVDMGVAGVFITVGDDLLDDAGQLLPVLGEGLHVDFARGVGVVMVVFAHGRLPLYPWRESGHPGRSR